jgi:hypothetical protein
VERQHVDRIGTVDGRFVAGEGDALPFSAALLGAAQPRLVDQDPPHHPGRDSEKVGAVAPFHLPLIDQPDVRLVNECRRLEGVTGRFAKHIRRGHAAKVVIYQRHEVFQGLTASVAPLDQQFSDRGLSRLVIRHVGVLRIGQYPRFSKC